MNPTGDDVVTAHLASEQTYRMTSDHMRTVLVDCYLRTRLLSTRVVRKCACRRSDNMQGKGKRRGGAPVELAIIEEMFVAYAGVPDVYSYSLAE